MNQTNRLFCLVFLIVIVVCAASVARADERPNTLWITIEDWSPDLSCYGAPGIHTPYVDKLAAEGNRSGLSAWYPTRYEKQRQDAVEHWKPWVFREPLSNIKRPALVLDGKRK